MRAVIMAGGKGTRLKSVAEDIPKPMVRIEGKPILEYQIESLSRSGVSEITLVVGYLGDVIRQYFGDGGRFSVRIDYITEETPLGTAGALYYLKDLYNDDFLLLFGDLMLDVDWQRFMAFHKSRGAEITLFAHPNSHPFDSDLITTDGDLVTGIDSKDNVRDYFYHNLVNAGVYCLSQRVLSHFTRPVKTDLEKDIVESAIDKGTVYVYRSAEYVKDCGTPQRLEAVSEDVRNGIVAKKSLCWAQKAVFLDRDGTLNVLRGFLHDADDFELLPGVAEAVREINLSGYIAVVVTNQPVVARGECTRGELERIHMKLETLLGRSGAYLDDIIYCPHHPDRGFEGEVASLKIDCDCRKPKTGMIKQAAARYNIDLSRSWIVGDSTVDIMTGINAKLHTILVHTGEAGKDGRYHVMADFEAKDLHEAVQIIKGGEYGLHRTDKEVLR